MAFLTKQMRTKRMLPPISSCLFLFPHLGSLLQRSPPDSQQARQSYLAPLLCQHNTGHVDVGLVLHDFDWVRDSCTPAMRTGVQSETEAFAVIILDTKNKEEETTHEAKIINKQGDA